MSMNIEEFGISVIFSYSDFTCKLTKGLSFIKTDTDPVIIANNLDEFKEFTKVAEDFMTQIETNLKKEIGTPSYKVISKGLINHYRTIETLQLDVEPYTIKYVMKEGNNIFLYENLTSLLNNNIYLRFLNEKELCENLNSIAITDALKHE